jgi:hypothetical protein
MGSGEWLLDEGYESPIGDDESDSDDENHEIAVSRLGGVAPSPTHRKP